MIDTNGIRDLQQILTSVAPSETKPVQQADTTQEPSGGTQPATISQQTDRTDLSAAGGLIAEALNGSDERSSKIAALQQAIADGTYNVSSSEVAGKMIESLLVR